MENVCIVLNEGPGSMRSWNGIRVAAGMIGVDVQVHIFLFDAAVYTAVKGQKPPEGLKELDLAKKLNDLLEMDVKVSACGTCVKAAGLTQEQFVDGVRIGTLTDFCNSVKNSKNVLVF